MWLHGRESQKIVPVAGQKNAAIRVREFENRLVRRIAGKSFPQKRDIVAKLIEQINQIVGHIVIEQNSHAEADDICLATSTSISPRWSS